jgi:peptide/nickel transport system permease protein
MSHDKQNGVPIASVLIVALFIINGIWGRYNLPHDPLQVTMANKYLPPFFVNGGSWQYVLGTDYLGRDVLSRVIMGGRVSLLVSVVAIVIGGFVGTLLGLIAGFFGGVLDKIIMRLSDAMLSIPGVLFALLFAISIGPGFLSVILCIAFTIWPRFTKIIRVQVLSLKERSFVVQAKVMGGSNTHIILRHLLPNQINTILVILVQAIGSSIMMEAGLSFLGLSVQPPNPTWGGMVTEGKNSFSVAWWSSVFPALCIMLVVVAFNFLGDWVKRKLNPK